MFKKKKIPADIILYITANNTKKSMELKSGLEVLNVEYEERTTKATMPYVVFNGNRESFSQSKSIIYEKIKVMDQQINRKKRRWMQQHGIIIVPKVLSWWQKIKRAWRQS